MELTKYLVNNAKRVKNNAKRGAVSLGLVGVLFTPLSCTTLDDISFITEKMSYIGISQNQQKKDMEYENQILLGKKTSMDITEDYMNGKLSKIAVSKFIRRGYLDQADAREKFCVDQYCEFYPKDGICKKEEYQIIESLQAADDYIESTPTPEPKPEPPQEVTGSRSGGVGGR
ncbi:MAG: hypothetical protein ABIA78_01380 [archaeon]